MSATSLEQILTERRGARHQTIVNVDEPTVKLVIFSLGEQFFAVPGEHIREILAPPPVFFVPGAPAAMEGVIHVRGDIESVLRLGTLLRLPEAPAGDDGNILLGQGHGMRSGIRVDRVLDVVDVPRSQLQNPPETLSDDLRPYVLSLVQVGERPVAVLDLDRLFADHAEGRR